MAKVYEDERHLLHAEVEKLPVLVRPENCNSWNAADNHHLVLEVRLERGHDHGLGRNTMNFSRRCEFRRHQRRQLALDDLLNLLENLQHPKRSLVCAPNPHSESLLALKVDKGGAVLFGIRVDDARDLDGNRKHEIVGRDLQNKVVVEGELYGSREPVAVDARERAVGLAQPDGRDPGMLHELVERELRRLPLRPLARILLNWNRNVRVARRELNLHSVLLLVVKHVGAGAVRQEEKQKEEEEEEEHGGGWESCDQL